MVTHLGKTDEPTTVALNWNRLPKSVEEPLLRRALGSADIYQLTRQHRYGILVVTERRDGTIVSQTYSSLASAGRKLDRARERGLVARAVLVELRAVADAAMVLGDHL